MFDHASKHLELLLKNSAFNFLSWCLETQSNIRVSVWYIITLSKMSAAGIWSNMTACVRFTFDCHVCLFKLNIQFANNNKNTWTFVVYLQSMVLAYWYSWDLRGAIGSNDGGILVAWAINLWVTFLSWTPYLKYEQQDMRNTKRAHITMVTSCTVKKWSVGGQ